MVYRKRKKSRQLLSQLTSVLTRRRNPFHSSQSITFSLSIAFMFSVVAKEQAVQPRGIIKRAFFSQRWLMHLLKDSCQV